MTSKVGRLTLVAVLIVAAVACRGDQRTASGLDGWLAGTSSEKFDMVANHLRGLDMTMVEIGYRYEQLYWAGEDANWELARYQLTKITLALDNGLERRPKRSASAQPFLTAGIPAINEAIVGRNQALFRERFAAVTSLCNACHATEQVAFFKVGPPNVRTGSLR